MRDATLVITKVLNALAEDVFDAWTDPKQIAEWYGPEGFVNEIHVFEAREGGEYRLTMNSPSGGIHELRGIFKTIQKPTKLVFTWAWVRGMGETGDEAETLVTVELKPLGAKTEMTMTHSGFVSEKSRDSHGKGWSSSFIKLEKILD